MPPSAFPKLHNAMWPANVVGLFLVAAFIVPSSGCGSGGPISATPEKTAQSTSPAAPETTSPPASAACPPEGTSQSPSGSRLPERTVQSHTASGSPEKTLQSATAAAKRRNFKSYVTFFTEAYQRDEITSALSFLTFQVPVRALAEREGPGSVARVDAILRKENAILKLVNADWKWLTEVSQLTGDDEIAAIRTLVSNLEDPAEVWSEILRINADVPKWFGRIENVVIDGDSATLKTYIEDRDLFDARLTLKRVGGDWRIDTHTSAN